MQSLSYTKNVEGNAALEAAGGERVIANSHGGKHKPQQNESEGAGGPLGDPLLSAVQLLVDCMNAMQRRCSSSEMAAPGHPPTAESITTTTEAEINTLIESTERVTAELSRLRSRVAELGPSSGEGPAAAAAWMPSAYHRGLTAAEAANLQDDAALLWNRAAMPLFKHCTAPKMKATRATIRRLSAEILLLTTPLASLHQRDLTELLQVSTHVAHDLIESQQLDTAQLWLEKAVHLAEGRLASARSSSLLPLPLGSAPLSTRDANLNTQNCRDPEPGAENVELDVEKFRSACADLHLAVAELHLLRGNYRSMVTHLQRHLSLFTSASLLARRLCAFYATALRRAGDATAALRALQPPIQSILTTSGFLKLVGAQGFATLHLQLAGSYLATGQADLCRQWAATAAESFPPYQPQSYLLLMKAELQLRHPSGAFTALHHFLTRAAVLPQCNAIHYCASAIFHLSLHSMADHHSGTNAQTATADDDWSDSAQRCEECLEMVLSLQLKPHMGRTAKQTTEAFHLAQFYLLGWLLHAEFQLTTTTPSTAAAAPTTHRPSRGLMALQTGPFPSPQQVTKAAAILDALDPHTAIQLHFPGSGVLAAAATTARLTEGTDGNASNSSGSSSHRSSDVLRTYALWCWRATELIDASMAANKDTTAAGGGEAEELRRAIIQLLRCALRFSPHLDSQEQMKLLLLLSGHQLALGNVEAALESAHSAHTKDPRCVWSKLQLFEVFVERHQWDDAETVLFQLASSEPLADVPSACASAADIAQRSGNAHLCALALETTLTRPVDEQHTAGAKTTGDEQLQPKCTDAEDALMRRLITLQTFVSCVERSTHLSFPKVQLKIAWAAKEAIQILRSANALSLGGQGGTPHLGGGGGQSTIATTTTTTTAHSLAESARWWYDVCYDRGVAGIQAMNRPETVVASRGSHVERNNNEYDAAAEGFLHLALDCSALLALIECTTTPLQGQDSSQASVLQQREAEAERSGACITALCAAVINRSIATSEAAAAGGGAQAALLSAVDAQRLLDTLYQYSTPSPPSAPKEQRRPPVVAQETAEPLLEDEEVELEEEEEEEEHPVTCEGEDQFESRGDGDAVEMHHMNMNPSDSRHEYVGQPAAEAAGWGGDVCPAAAAAHDDDAAAAPSEDSSAFPSLLPPSCGETQVPPRPKGALPSAGCDVPATIVAADGETCKGITVPTAAPETTSDTIEPPSVAVSLRRGAGVFLASFLASVSLRHWGAGHGVSDPLLCSMIQRHATPMDGGRPPPPVVGSSGGGGEGLCAEDYRLLAAIAMAARDPHTQMPLYEVAECALRLCFDDLQRSLATALTPWPSAAAPPSGTTTSSSSSSRHQLLLPLHVSRLRDMVTIGRTLIQYSRTRQRQLEHYMWFLATLPAAAASVLAPRRHNAATFVTPPPSSFCPSLEWCTAAVRFLREDQKVSAEISWLAADAWNAGVLYSNLSDGDASSSCSSGLTTTAADEWFLVAERLAQYLPSDDPVGLTIADQLSYATIS